MLIIGCDFHPGFQQVAIFDNQTGEEQERRLGHREEAEQFYRSLAGQTVRVGMEACGHYPWFERLLAELGFELWLGDAAEIRARVVRRQKTDRRDAEHVLRLMREDRFPRIWVPSLEERDVRQLLVHRHKQVQARTRVKNQLQAMALSQGVQKKRKLWTVAGRQELEKLELLPYAAERRKQLLRSLDGLEAEIEPLDRRVEEEVRQRPGAVKLQTHPGVGPVTALAMVLTLGPAERFASGKHVGSYFGLIPSEYSSGGQQKLGHISKQGSSFLRFLLVEAGQTAVRYDAELGRFYRRLAARKHRALAKVAVARKLAVRLYLMLREDWNYAQLCRAVVQASPSHPVVGGQNRTLE
ncbi:MAG TPA: IS110 family transposase [Candidatus Binatus sp.]|jgi:transposase|nr:IS110 family transposase [Candidatus Binatus sp.]